MSELVQVQSPDGTHVGFERRGDGPPLLLVHGSTSDRTRWAPILPALERRFTLLIPDRRGRGLSLDESGGPYGLAREADDLIAVANSVPAADRVRVFAHSFGALVTMEAASRSKAFGALVLYEPPFATPGIEVADAAVITKLAERLEAGDREGALVHFCTGVLGLSTEAVEGMKGTPRWKARLAAVHSVLREVDTVQSWTFRSSQLAAIEGPVRLLLGSATTPALDASTRALATAMPDWELVSLEGQGHQAIDAAPDLVVRRVLEHFGRP